MGLTTRSTGLGAAKKEGAIERRAKSDRIVALAGNPNVGKSTVFNGLTGMNQHTGNWPGKTVANARGFCKSDRHGYVLVDIPGTYSLFAHSAEEEIARDFLCFGDVDAVVVVCDATCPERNLNLVLQIMESGKKTILCLNLMDEAKRKHIRIDRDLLSDRLQIPIVPIVARRRRDLLRLLHALDDCTDAPAPSPIRIPYPEALELAIRAVQTELEKHPLAGINARWLSLKLLDRDEGLIDRIKEKLGEDFLQRDGIQKAMDEAWKILSDAGIDEENLRDLTVSATVRFAERICRDAVRCEEGGGASFDRRADRLLTGKRTAYPVMLLLLALIFFLTISAANVPSAWLSALFGNISDLLRRGLTALRAPPVLISLLVDGVFGVSAWVVSVMLPPMAIFFPLFTLLEDAGYLPRVAYNLDRPFHACNACGKQALTMCMGFGCNAAGVVGCRIIDSPRERLLAIITNSFVPCNGRFPALIALISLFFVGVAGSLSASLLSAGILTLVILFGVLLTFASTKLLSATVLRGVPSSFTLELPPYRRPQPAKVLVRSIFDRTLFVLGRSVIVAAPAGLIIWILANVSVGDASLLSSLCTALDPFARLMGLDGVILAAFILGLPANEIVIPIMLMAYTSQGTLCEAGELTEMRQILLANGWTWQTVVCVILFFLCHWPCSTTLLTIQKETGNIKWTLLAALLPTAIGILLCMLFRLVSGCFL